MGFNDHINFELNNAVDELVYLGLLDKKSKGYGIAQRALTSGLDSLSPKQRYIYKNEVEKLLERKRPSEAYEWAKCP
jgi:hypothetical protein